MTKGGNGKPKMLGRLIFGEKRKQHASPSRHQVATRNGTSMIDASASGFSSPGNKTPINYQDWAAWRTQLNEQMGNGATEQADLKQMRQFLHSNTFYQQHSRDPSNGRYNGVRLLFSIPHAKLKPELIDGSRREASANGGGPTTTTYDQKKTRTKSHDRLATSVNTVSAGSLLTTDKTISQLLPKKLVGDTDGFLRISEQMIAADTARTRRAIPVACSSTDRVHSTLQKAVKDGNVLEKIKAFEMQAAAAQAESTTKLGGGNGSNHRIQTVASPLQSHRALSPGMAQPNRHLVSPISMQYDSQQQHVRSHRSRHVHPASHRRDGNSGPMTNRESRKGAHVLEPAHGDIILKRRTPSQKTVNDEDYSITAMSSMALSASQGHHHRQQQYHPRAAGASRSRHRQEVIHDKRTQAHHENTSKKHQPKPKETTVTKPTSTKSGKSRRWLRGRKETPTETATDSVKQDLSATKSTKNKKNKKNTEQEKGQPTSASPTEKRSASLDNDRMSHTDANELTKSEVIHHPASLTIEEENESDPEATTVEKETAQISPKEKNIQPIQEADVDLTSDVERRPNTTKSQRNLSNMDGDVLSKVEDDARFSRPTDDHAHRSELNDDDDECQSEGDVFLDEPSIPLLEQQSPKTIPCSIEGSSSERRWQWSKESGGLIDKGTRKKQTPITIITRKNRINPGEEQVVYEAPQSEHTQASASSTHTLKKKTQASSSTIATTQETKMSKQLLHAIVHRTSNDQDEFFDNGLHTNAEETPIEKPTST